MDEVVDKAESSCVCARGAYFRSCAKLYAATGTLLLKLKPLHLKPAHCDCDCTAYMHPSSASKKDEMIVLVTTRKL